MMIAERGEAENGQGRFTQLVVIHMRRSRQGPSPSNFTTRRRSARNSPVPKPLFLPGPPIYAADAPGSAREDVGIIAAGAKHGPAIHRGISESARGYIGFVEELPGANTQGATLEEVRANLQEAVALVLDANRTLAQEDALGPDVIREPLKVRA